MSYTRAAIALFEVRRVEDHPPTDDQRRPQHRMAPAIHGGVLAARVAWLREQLFADAVGFDNLSIERGAESSGETALACPGRADEHDNERARHLKPV